jgi:hypothetical protein
VTTSIARVRAARLTVVVCLFAAIVTGPKLFIKAPHLADLQLVPSLAAQVPASYTYTLIADGTSCSNLGSPVLNNAGDVAFWAGPCVAPIGPGVVVRRGSGSGPLTDIYTFTAGSTFSVPDSIISMNDGGTVAFPGSAGVGARQAILVGNGGPVSPVVDTAVHTQFGQVLRPSINNSGAVAFMGVTGTVGYDTVAVAQSGGITRIAGPGTPTPTTGGLTHAIEPALNNSGVVRFVGQAAGGPGLFTGSGGPLTTIALNSTSVFAGINDLGRVAFVVNSASVRWGDGGPPMIVASSPTFQSFSGEASISNASVVAFHAQLGSGPTGIFIGPNPATDTVIRSGDVIPGVGTVANVSMSEEAINDAGQVAFTALIQAGTGTITRAIIRADPIRIATTTALGISPSPATLGEPVTLTASVTPTSGVASGQVQFFEEATLLGTAPLVNGVASFQTSALSLGPHRLLAMFAGSSGFLPSVSPAVPLTIEPAPPLQAPLNLRAFSIVGNRVAFRWDLSPIGPRPTSFIVEGGIAPGQVLASLDTGGPFPVLTVSAPTGAFYVRVRAVTASQQSGPSNEIRIFVNTPTAPSSPADLLALVNGSSLALTWRPTFLGGAATAYVLNVAGSVTASLPLGQATSVAFGSVPAGTYTLSVSASNATGSSAPSNAVTVTVPGPCSGAPLAPAGFLAYRVGSTIFVVWDPPPSGPAPTQYVLNVSGAFNASLPTTARTLSGAVGAGSYNLSVAASNACGTSAATAVQTVTVP